MPRGTRPTKRSGVTKFQVVVWIVSALVVLSMILSTLPLVQ